MRNFPQIGPPMTTQRYQEVRCVFESLLSCSGAEQDVRLRQLREQDATLAEEIESLLVAHRRSSGFISLPVMRFPARPEMADEGVAGTVIGPYRLIEPVGEGGMGRVWRAEQEAPLRRTVALKLIKPGMDTYQVIRRFESERQSLAIMDHPAIAKVFDAGTTPLGRPYFAMEYVEGVPITTYCDRHRLSIRERLRLFVQVCEGVQHAHRKAVLHRDVKPTNILVTVVDGKPVPKIIDFGIARAMAVSDDETQLTLAGAILGTPNYMSPEQAAGDGAKLDTRADVYSLGVVLFELLTGTLPFELRGRPLTDVLQTLRAELPPRPSTRIRSAGMSASTAHNRRIAQRRLYSELRGDLDAIVMKAIEKDPAQRYGSASDLAADVRRFLREEAIEARPAGTLYLLRKFLARHRAVAGLAVVFLLLCVAFAAWQNVQIRRITREQERADRIASFMTGMFRISDPGESRGNQVTAREILDRAAADIDHGLTRDPALKASLMSTIGQVYFQLGLYFRAEAMFRQALELRKKQFGDNHLETAASLNDLADTASSIGNRQEAKKLDLQVLAIRKSLLGDNHPDTLKAINNYAVDLISEGRYREAEELQRKVYQAKTRVLGAEHVSTLMSMENLGDTLSREGRYGDAEHLKRSALAIKRRTLGADHPETLRSVLQLSETLYDEGRYPEAESLDRELLATRTRVLGRDHPDTCRAMVALANPLENEERLAEAETLLRRALDLQRRKLGPEHPDVLLATGNLAGVLAEEGKFAEAERLDRQTLDARVRLRGPEHVETLHAMNRLAMVLMLRGSLDEAEPLARQARAAQVKLFGADHPEVTLTDYTLACVAARRRQYSASLALLRTAVDHDLKPNVALGIARDPALAALHGQPGFVKLIAYAQEHVAKAMVQ